jgi:hypothetical protein
MNLQMSVLFYNDLRDFTPHPRSLSPLRGEGTAIGYRHYSFGLRHSYDGVQRTARPANFGSWSASRSEGKRGFRATNLICTHPLNCVNYIPTAKGQCPHPPPDATYP